MAGRDPDPVPEPSLWLAPSKGAVSSSPGQRAPAVPPPATQAHRAVDCIGSMATSAQRGCPEFRGTSVAARCASGCDDLLIVHGGWDSSGDFGVERGAQLGQVQVAVDPAELLAGLDHAGGAPA